VKALEATKAADLGNGTFRFDFGQNLAGFCTLTLGFDPAAVAAAVGDDAVVAVRMMHTEVLGGDGVPYVHTYTSRHRDPPRVGV
jgi:hypothetical protein